MPRSAFVFRPFLRQSGAVRSARTSTNGDIMARSSATPAEPAETAAAKTPEQIQAETDALLAMFGGEAEGPSEAEIERESRIEQVASTIGAAAVDVKALLEGTPNPESVLKTLQSLKTAKDRATAAIRSIPDEVLVSTVPLSGTERAVANVLSTEAPAEEDGL